MSFISNQAQGTGGGFFKKDPNLVAYHENLNRVYRAIETFKNKGVNKEGLDALPSKKSDKVLTLLKSRWNFNIIFIKVWNTS